MKVSNYLSIIIVILVAAFLGYSVGTKFSITAPSSNSTRPIGQGEVNDFLRLCIEEPEATCSVKILDRELYVSLGMYYESWTITSLKQARSLIETSKKLQLLKNGK